MTIKFLPIILFSAIFFAFEIVTAQIPNGGFENWTTDEFGNLNPVAWETTNDNPDISVEPYVPANQGNYSMRVKAFDPGIFPIGGIAITEFPYTQRPSFFSGWIKTNVMPGDAVYVIVSLWKGDSIIASPDSCTFVIDSTINEYTYFSYGLSYQSALIPDSANIMVIAGKSGYITVGTEIILDELAFSTVAGFEENRTEETAFAGPAYPNPASGRIFIPLTLNQGTRVDVDVYNSAGTRLRTINFGSREPGHHTLELSVEDFANGLYTYRLTGVGFQQAGKFTVSK